MNQNVKTALIIGGIIVAVLVVLPLIFGLVSGWQSCGYGMMGPWMMGGFSGMWLGPILSIVILGLIIWAVVAAVRPSESSGSGSATTSSALEVLKRRYARGEISQEEYEEKKKELA